MSAQLTANAAEHYITRIKYHVLNYMYKVTLPPLLYQYCTKLRIIYGIQYLKCSNISPGELLNTTPVRGVPGAILGYFRYSCKTCQQN